VALSRRHPLFSLPGCLGGLVLIAGIVVAVVLSGGAIFSPGALTAYAEKQQPLGGFTSHADFENDCTQCHAPFTGIAPERCEVCHVNIGAERSGQTGLHGKLRPDQAARCEVCHRDHKGRDLNPNDTALKKFDHTILGFSLARHIVDYSRAPLECQGCHTSADFQLDVPACVQCHGDYDKTFMLDHLRAFGLECRACHDGVDAMAGFDHALTNFPLAGQHGPLDCAACHTPEVRAQDTPAQCAACHAEPPVHVGVFSAQDCGECHTPEAWSPVMLADKPGFRHADTAFQLVNHATTYDGAPLTCGMCHTHASAGDFSLTTQTCTDCHSNHDTAFMAEHLQKFGPNCTTCHDGTGNMQNFDHNLVFPLEGQHAALECSACHIEQKFRGTPQACAACHQEPAIHASVFGLNCAACHTATAWAPALLTRHTFPLDHGEQGEIACATCHTASYTAYTCYGCHEHDPAEIQDKHAEKGIRGDQLINCAACHPTGREEEGER
jgi:hypothetical protein